MIKTKNKLILIIAPIIIALFTLALVFISPASIALADDFANISGQTFTNEDYKFLGYSIRYDSATTNSENSGNSALRFNMGISPELYAYISSAQGVSTGTLIMPAYYVNGDASNLTVNSTGNNGEVIPFNLDTTSAWELDGESGLYQAVTYINNIAKEDYGFDIAVRGYLKVGDNYYYTAPSAPKSFASVANAEYKLATSNFSADQKADLKDSVLKFEIEIDGVKSNKYYGDTLSAPTAQPDKIFVGYRIYGRQEFWQGNTTVYGNAKLTSIFVSTKNYYSMLDDSATINVDNLPSGDFAVNVIGDGVEYSKNITATCYDSQVTLTGLTGLTAGKGYLATITSAKGNNYFAYFTAVNDILPYKGGNDDEFADYVDFDFHEGNSLAHEILTVKDQNGTDIEFSQSGKNVSFDGIAYNPTKNVIDKLVYVTDNNGDSYCLLVKSYTYVIYDDFMADEFFAIEDCYLETSEDGMRNGCYALAKDVTLTEKIDRTRTKGTFSGLFDGFGHTITYTSYIKKGDRNCSPALFGYNFTGTIKNLGIDFTLAVPANAQSIYSSDFNVLVDYASNCTLENVYINVKCSYTNSNRDLASKLFNARGLRDKFTFKNVVVVNSLINTGGNGQYRLLTGYDRIWKSYHASDNNPASETNHWNTGAEQYVGANNLISPQLVSFTDVHFIVKDTVNAEKVGLAHTSDTGTVYFENNQPDECKYNQAWYKGVFAYKYSTAKTVLTKRVGNWLLDYSNGIENVTASYIR